MPGILRLLRGPAGGGKSQIARRALVSGDTDLQADTTALYAALSGVERGPDGRYPPRLESDPLLPLTTYVRAVVVRDALRRGLRVIITSSRRDDEDHWRGIAREAGAAFDVETVEPAGGRDAMAARLADPETGALSGECSAALSRWYDDA